MKKIISTLVLLILFVPVSIHAQQNTITLPVGPGLSSYSNCASFDACPGFRDALIEALTQLLTQLLEEKIAEAQESTPASVEYSDFKDSTYLVKPDGSLAGESAGFVPEIGIQIWSDFKKIAPQEYIEDYMSYLRVYFDEDDFFAAYVETDDNDYDKWGLGVNLSDFNDSSLEQKKALTETLIHEFAHVLTLNTDQIDSDVRERRCGTYYSTGCAYANSYIHSYVEQFWDEDDFENSGEIEDEKDPDQKDEIADAYFEKTGDYVSPYATWHPDEDIAESFAYFVLKDKPTSASQEIDAKLLFFYNYPELATMRLDIRNNFKELFNF